MTTISCTTNEGQVLAILDQAPTTPNVHWDRIGDALSGKFQRRLNRKEAIRALKGIPPTDAAEIYGIDKINICPKLQAVSIPSEQSRVSMAADWINNYVKVEFGLMCASSGWSSLAPQEIQDPSLGYIVKDEKFYGFDPDDVQTLQNLANYLKVDSPSTHLPLRTWWDIQKKFAFNDLHLIERFSREQIMSGLLDGLCKHEYQVPTEFHGDLRAYQDAAYKWLSFCHENWLGGILAFDMGLGKTCTTIALLLAKKSFGQSLVVCPLSLLWNWEQEISKFAPKLSTCVYQGANRFTSNIDEADVLITTYDVLKSDIDHLQKRKLNVLILDEAQKIKNPDTENALACGQLESRCPVALSGTPFENRPLDLWSITNTVMPGALGDREKFLSTTNPRLLSGDDRALEAFRISTSIFMFRKLKEDVLDDLPDLVEQHFPLEMNRFEATLYNEILSANGTGNPTIDIITALLQQCAHPHIHEPLGGYDLHDSCLKYKALCEILMKVKEAEDKSILFTPWIDMLNLIEIDLPERLGIEVFRIDGSIERDQRTNVLKQFEQSSKGSLLIGNYKTLGEGHNITCANHVIHYGGWWNPAIIDQATDRAHRIGQKKTVISYHLFYKNTVDDLMQQHIARKRQLGDQVLLDDVEHTDDWSLILKNVLKVHPEVQLNR